MQIPDHPIAELRDLLERMLNVDPEKRYNAAQCLSHPYFHLALKSNRDASKDRRTCVACSDEYWLDEGVECEYKHYICGPCFHR